MKSKLSIAAMWLLAFVPLVLVAALYRLLPDQVPMHWGFDGVVSRYGSKNELWFLAALGPVFALLFQFLPRLDPKKRSYERFQKYYEAFAVVMTAFIAVIMGIALVESFRPGTLSVGRAVSILLGLLFVFLGNMMGKIKPNYFFGVRTPWTLADPDVWNRSHRLAGRLFFLAGLVILGGVQAWWLEPVLTRLGDYAMVGATLLTAFNDNAAVTFLASTVPNLPEAVKYSVVAGAVTGGGLTVIANAPNPAGQAILGKYFKGINPLWLFAWAAFPTAIVFIFFTCFGH